MKITALEMANVKAVKAVRLEPTSTGLTIIGGRNGQGKTSVLDAIAYALGGEKLRPTNLKRDGAVNDPYIHVETDDGLVIERKGKNSDLKVTDSTGRKCGQNLLNSIVGKLAINLPSFMSATATDKANMLLEVLGVGDELKKLDMEEKSAYDTRRLVGQQMEIKRKAAEDMPYHEDVGDEPVSIAELVKSQQDILAHNGAIEKSRTELSSAERELEMMNSQMEDLKRRISAISQRIYELKKNDGELKSTEELEKKIADFENINSKIAENRAKLDREAEADSLAEQYDSLTSKIMKIRDQRIKLLEGCDLPLPGLSVVNGELLLDGKSWDCMSGAQQLIVACAIASRVNPKCKFVLLDKLEQLDLETLKEFDTWLSKHDLQCLATRVSTGDECTIIIQDGEVVESNDAKHDPFADDGY